MTRRDNRLSRRGARRSVRRRILIFCGGVRTEPAYFDGLRKSDAAGDVVLEVRHKGVSPTGLVTAAKEYVDKHPGEHDEVWCVVDVDEFRDIPTATSAAARSNIKVAVSNPCFELWLLLHHVDRRAAAQRCQELCAELTKALGHYDKTQLRFGDFDGRLPVAVARGRSLDPGNGNIANPSTGVWRLVEGIVSPAKEVL